MPFDTRRARLWIGTSCIGILAALAPSILPAQASARFVATQNSGAITYDDYTPWQCVSAIERMRIVSVRRQDDTLRFTPAADTIPDGARQTARACVAHLSVESTNVEGLLPLMQVYLAAGNEAGAKAALDKRLSATKTPAERSQAVLDALTALADRVNPPLNQPLTTYLLGELDRLPGSIGAAGRLQGYFGLGIYYLMTRADDDSLVVKYVNAALASAKGLDSAGQTNFAELIGNARGMLQFVAMWSSNGPLSTQAIPPLQGEVIVGADGARPTPGHLTLLMLQRATSRQSVAAVHRLKARYGDSLDVVYGGKTQGHFKLQGPLSYEAERELWRDFYKKDLNVDGAVLLEQTPMHTRADGRVIREQTVNDRTYPSYQIVLIDGEGRVRAAYGGWGAPVEIRLERAIDKALHGA